MMSSQMKQNFFAGRLMFCGKAVFQIKVLCLLGLVVFAPGAFVSPAGAQMRGQEYMLGPGDVIGVTVLRHPEMSTETMTIGANGRINLPVVGQLRAAGKSIGQLDQEITNALRVRLRKPEVTVVLRNARARQVFVLGAVARPGAYELKPGWRVSEALAMAGGLTGRPELVEASISRTNQKPVTLNVTTIISDSSRAENRVLQPGDTLRLTERTLPISVSGQVQRSGSYNLPLGGNVVDALALAGGALPQAALSRARVKRAGGEVVAVDLYKASVLGDPNSSMAMKAGDVLIIPESDARVTVLGAVQKPGFFPLQDGRVLRVAEAIALAGGPQERSALSQ
jgi:protein involved in polysaccharide export with SLBB domain